MPELRTTSHHRMGEATMKPNDFELEQFLIWRKNPLRVEAMRR